MARTDYLSDEDGDLLIVNGDFVKGDSDFEHIKKIIESKPGDFRQQLTVGFAAKRFRNAKESLKTRFASELKEQLTADAYKVNDIDVSQKDWWKNFTVDAE